MYQKQGVISQNQKNSISQKFPNRSFHVIHQNVCIFILHVAALLVFMAIFFNLKFSSGALCLRSLINWLCGYSSNIFTD